MKTFKQYLTETNNKNYINITDINIDKDFILVDTNTSDSANNIINAFKMGKTPLDKKRVMSMVNTLLNKMLPPVEIDNNNNLINGYHRYYAYKIAKINKIPFIRYKRLR